MTGWEFLLWSAGIGSGWFARVIWDHRKPPLLAGPSTVQAVERMCRCGHPFSHHDAGECWTNEDGTETFGETACPCSWLEDASTSLTPDRAGAEPASGSRDGER